MLCQFHRGSIGCFFQDDEGGNSSDHRNQHNYHSEQIKTGYVLSAKRANRQVPMDKFC